MYADSRFGEPARDRSARPRSGLVDAAAPRVSVVLSVHNDAPYLADAIESILAQSFADFEFLIVDDGSTDGSGAIVDAFAGRDARIRVLRQANQGLVASLNRAIGEARAPWIARMDGDDVALPLRFERQMDFLDRNPDCDVLGTDLEEIDGEGRVRGTLRPHPARHEDIVAALRTGSPICHPSVMMRRRALVEAGGYRAAYRHCEDFDLWLRLVPHARFANLPERLLRYRRTAAQVSVRHAMAQQTAAAIALLAHGERLAGRRDPTEGLPALPPLAGLDDVFGREGITARVRAQLAPTIGYSRDAMRAGGFEILVAHVRSGGAHTRLWRTAARLVLFREWRKAMRLALLLIACRPR